MASDIDEEHMARLRVRFRGRPNLEIRKCDLCDSSDFEPLRGAFDSVVCLNVVEHVKDDLGALRNIFSALKPGGRAVILVPQDQKAYGTLDEVLGHYRRYSEAQLRERMEAAGFEVERMLHFNRVTRPGWRFNGQVLKRTIVQPISIAHIRLAGAVVAENRPLVSLAGGIGDRGGASTGGGESRKSPRTK